MKPKMVEAGQPIKVVTLDGEELALTILLEIEAGKDRRVYKVRDAQGRMYAYKHGKKRAIRKEIERTEEVAAANVLYATMIAHGSGFVLRSWVEGARGDDWLRSWESFGAPLRVEATDDLYAMLDTCARAGLYIGKLDPEDMVLDARLNRWFIVDCGGVKKLPPSEAAERYFWKMLERWGGFLDRHRNSMMNLMIVLSPLGKDYPIDVPLEEESAPASTKKGKKERDDSSGEVDDEEGEDDEEGSDEEGDDDGDDDEGPSSGSLPPDSSPDSAPPDSADTQAAMEGVNEALEAKEKVGSGLVGMSPGSIGTNPGSTGTGGLG